MAKECDMEAANRDNVLRARQLIRENRLSELSELFESLEGDMLDATEKIAAGELGIWSDLLIRIRRHKDGRKSNADPEEG